MNILAQSIYYEDAEKLAEEGKYEEAIEIELKGINLIKEQYGKENIPYIVSLTILANYNSLLGDYIEAINLSSEALDIAKIILWPEHPYYETILLGLTLYNSQINNYSEAFNYESEILNIRKKIYGIESPEYLEILKYIANYNAQLSNYNQAIKIGREALDLIEKLYGIYSLEYANVLNNLSCYYSDLGNNVEAIQLGLDALKILLDQNVQSRAETACIYNNLATFYAHQRRYDQALDYGVKNLEIRKVIDGENSPEFALALSNLASYYSGFENYDEALKLGEEALELRTRFLGTHNLDYANSLHNMSNYNIKKGNFEEGIKYEKEAFNVVNEILGIHHPIVISYLKNLIFFYYLNGNTEEMFQLLWYSSPYIIENLNSIFKLTTSKEREFFWIREEGWFNFLIPYFIYNDSENNVIDMGYDIVLLSKGILLNSEMEFDQFIGETGNEELLEKYNEIKTLRLQLNKLYEKPIAERFCDTDSLERHVNELERKLMEESSEYGDYTKNLSVTWEDVQKGLDKKDAAIEFVHFPLNQDSTMYMAYVLRPEMESPSMVKLFEEKDLSKLTGSKLSSDKNNRKSSQLIWGKLQSELEGVENIYFAPDGILHQIPIEYLPDFEDDEKLISDRYNLHRVSSTRQLALRKDSKKADKAVVYGGILYDTNPELLAEDSRKYEHRTDRGFQPWYNLADTLSMRSGVKYLPFTLTEATYVSTMLEENHQQPMLITGNEATEASFKNLSGQKNGILHIATHGFYWQEEEADKISMENERLMFMSQFGDNARRNVEDKALTRTGLFMAGANNALSGKEIPEDIDDGILTASEIANLDLRGTDLVVLSACQTGMGDIGGDGVFGLQRGFKKAGANSILMSLWDVDDAATGMFMTEFYRNFTEGKSKQESLKGAQNKVRNFKGEINGEYRNFSHPRYWAAFILLDGLD